MTQTLNLRNFRTSSRAKTFGHNMMNISGLCNYPRLCCQHPNLANPRPSVPGPTPPTLPQPLPGRLKDGSQQTIPDSRTPEGYSLTVQSHLTDADSNAEIKVNFRPRVGMSQAAPGIASRLPSPYYCSASPAEDSGEGMVPSHMFSAQKYLGILFQIFSSCNKLDLKVYFFLPLDNSKSGPKTLLKMCVYELETFSGATSITCRVQRASFWPDL